MQLSNEEENSTSPTQMKDQPEQHGVVSNWSQWGRGHQEPPHWWYLVAAFRSAKRDRKERGM